MPNNGQLSSILYKNTRLPQNLPHVADFLLLYKLTSQAVSFCHSHGCLLDQGQEGQKDFLSCFNTVKNATKLLAGQALILGISSDFSHIPDISEYDAHNLVILFTYLFKIFGHTLVGISACLDF